MKKLVTLLVAAAVLLPLSSYAGEFVFVNKCTNVGLGLIQLTLEPSWDKDTDGIHKFCISGAKTVNTGYNSPESQLYRYQGEQHDIDGATKECSYKLWSITAPIDHISNQTGGHYVLAPNGLICQLRVATSEDETEYFGG